MEYATRKAPVVSEKASVFKFLEQFRLFWVMFVNTNYKRLIKYEVSSEKQLHYITLHYIILYYINIT
jgi:hypothetical protein